MTGSLNRWKGASKGLNSLFLFLRQGSCHACLLCCQISKHLHPNSVSDYHYLSSNSCGFGWDYSGNPIFLT